MPLMLDFLQIRRPGRILACDEMPLSKEPCKDPIHSVPLPRVLCCHGEAPGLVTQWCNDLLVHNQSIGCLSTSKKQLKNCFFQGTYQLAHQTTELHCIHQPCYGLLETLGACLEGIESIPCGVFDLNSSCDVRFLQYFNVFSGSCSNAN